MNFEEATDILLGDVFTEEGTYVRLRLGEDPGRLRVERLCHALRAIWHASESAESLPRDIAFACGVILRFSEECFANRVWNVSADNAVVSKDDVHRVTRHAFDVLAGHKAKAWMVSEEGGRPPGS